MLSGPRLGIALRTVAAVSFSVMGALFKLAAETGDASAAEMLFYRAAVGIPVLLVWVLTGPGLAQLGTKRPFMHAGRALLGNAAILCTFQALTMLPLAEITTIGFMAPVFATILSFLILREQVGPHRWFAVFCGFAGVAIIMQPGHSGQALPALGLALALVGALGAAGVTIAVRQMRGEHVAAIVFWFMSLSLVTSGLMLPFAGHWHDWPTLLLLLGGGAAGIVAQITMTSSLRHAAVSVLMPFDYIQLLGAIAFGWFLMSDVPGWTTLAGGALIALSGLYTVWREYRLQRAQDVRPPQSVS
ncbi:MAG: EamA/RhaT family transporter [Sphingomonas sp.]|nr:MAG: EamA/RhaT family transporter [Sphingomonas sp.]